MDKGYHKIFWGLIILSFYINLGPIKILPAFVGWLTILGGINILVQEYHSESFEISAKYSKVLVGLSIIGGLISLFAASYLNNSIVFSYFPIVIVILELLMVNKILEGSIERLKEDELEVNALELEGSQRTYTILFTISTIGIIVAITFNIGYLLTIVAIFSLLIRFFAMGMINNLKKTYLKIETE